MIRFLLFLAIWLRKYQGRGESYDIIFEAFGILLNFIIFIIIYPLYRSGVIVKNQITSDLISITIIVILASYLSVILQLLLNRLREGSIHLHYLEFKKMKLFSILSFVIFFLIAIMELVIN